jgi:hypothetical protein
VAALVDLVPVHQVVLAPLGPASRRTINLAGKDRHGGRDGDVHRVEVIGVFSQYSRAEDVPELVSQWSMLSSISSRVSDRSGSPRRSAMMSCRSFVSLRSRSARTLAAERLMPYRVCATVSCSSRATRLRSSRAAAAAERHLLNDGIGRHSGLHQACATSGAEPRIV